MPPGGQAYISNPVFLGFYRHTMTEYIRRWQLEPGNVPSRPRIMNRRLDSGKFLDAGGIPGYTESRKDFNIGIDVLGGEYRTRCSSRRGIRPRHTHRRPSHSQRCGAQHRPRFCRCS
jgi:hypothetical protein